MMVKNYYNYNIIKAVSTIHIFSNISDNAIMILNANSSNSVKNEVCTLYRIIIKCKINYKII